LWYRSPELLLGSTKYGPEVDMWSCGCILVELMTKLTPFHGWNELDQLDQILRLCGSFNESNWPGISQLPLYPQLIQNRKNMQAYKNQLKNTFHNWDSHALDLLEKLFCPPKDRITASDALTHPFFTQHPLPCLPEQIPNFPCMHEYEVKMQREANKVPSESATKKPKLNHPNPPQSKEFRQNQLPVHVSNSHHHPPSNYNYNSNYYNKQTTNRPINHASILGKRPASLVSSQPSSHPLQPQPIMVPHQSDSVNLHLYH